MRRTHPGRWAIADTQSPLRFSYIGKEVDETHAEDFHFPMSLLTITVELLVSRNSKEAPEDLLMFSKVIHS